MKELQQTQKGNSFGIRLYPADKMGISQTKTLKKPKRDQLKGKTIVGRYKIIVKLGKGGMGVVYKANDTPGVPPIFS